MHRRETEKTTGEDLGKISLPSDNDSMFPENTKIIFQNYIESKGIETYCLTNDLEHFHILTNSNVDIIHDIIEVKNFFKCLIELNILKLKEISERISNFKYDFYYQKSLSPAINIDKPCASNKLTASQNLCLILHFPFVFFDIQPKDVKFWESVINLIKIINIVFSSKVQKSEKYNSLHLKSILENYKLFLIQKHYMMTYYLGIIKKNIWLFKKIYF